MSFKTDLLKLKPQVLETIISNMPKPAEKFRLTIKFPSEEKYKEFLRFEDLRREEEDNQVQLKSQSEQDEQNSSQVQEQSVDSKSSKQMSQSNASSIKNVKKKQEPKKAQQFNYINLEFQNAIIYKQHYQDKFNDIGVKNKVKVSILPKKIKFVGQEVDDIESAMEDSQKLIDSIVIRLISKYGAQAHESQYIKRELRSKDIKILKVLNKYYLWYQLKETLDKESNIKIEKQINQLRDRMFQNSCHKFYSLLRDAEFQEYFDKQSQIKNDSNESYKLHLLDEDINFFQSKNQKWYLKLYQLCKAKMFNNQIKQKLNELYTQEKFIQLTASKDFLIIHCDKQEQLSLREEQIKLHYRDFDFFFITFDQNQGCDEILQTLEQFQYTKMKKSTSFDDTTAYIHSISNLQILKEEKKELKQHLTICLAFNMIKHNNKEMIEQLVKKLFKINSNIKISFQLSSNQLLECDQNPKLQFEYQAEQKVIHVMPKNNIWSNFQTIINEYIINHNLLKFDKSPVDKTVLENSMSVTSPIQDSTFMNPNDKTEDQINHSNILDSLKQPQNMSMALGMKKKQVQNEDEQKWNDFLQVKKLKLYDFFLPQTQEEYNAKFDQNVKLGQFLNNVKIVIKKRREFQELIKPFTSIQFKPHGVKVNPLTKNYKFYQKSQDKADQIITMFAETPKRIGKSKIEQNFAIYPLSDSDKIKKNGYLINIKRKNIYPTTKRISKTQYICFFQAKNSDSYEVVRYLQHVGPLM